MPLSVFPKNSIVGLLQCLEYISTHRHIQNTVNRLRGDTHITPNLRGGGGGGGGSKWRVASVLDVQSLFFY